MEGSFLFKVFNAETQSTQRFLGLPAAEVLAWVDLLLRFLTQSGRVAEVSRAACGRGIGVGRSFIKVFIAEAQSRRARREVLV